MDLIFIEFYRSFFMAIRYPTNFVIQVVMSVSLFYLLLMGGGMFHSQVIEVKRVELMLINYFFWTIALPTISSVPQSIEEDAKAGTFEQVLQSVYSTAFLFYIRGLAHCLLQIVISLCILSVLIIVTGVVPQITWQVCISIFSVILTALGMSLLIGGLGVRVKRTGMVIAALQLPLLYLLIFPFEQQFTNSDFEWWLFLPFVADSIQARHLVMSGELNIKYYFYSYSMLLVWTIIGVVGFAWMLRYTKKRAKTNGY